MSAARRRRRWRAPAPFQAGRAHYGGASFVVSVSGIRESVSAAAPIEEEPSEQAEEDSHGQEEAGPTCDPARPVWRQPVVRHDDVDVWMVGHRRAPGVEHGSEADHAPEMLRLCRDRGERVSARRSARVSSGIEASLPWNVFAGEPESAPALAGGRFLSLPSCKMEGQDETFRHQHCS